MRPATGWLAALAATLGVLGVAFVSAAPARADIIMFDFHVSTGEVNAARRAAEARGESLIVLPPLTAAIRRQYNDLQYLKERNEAQDKANDNALERARARVPRNEAEIRRLEDRSTALMREYGDLSRRMTALDSTATRFRLDMFRDAVRSIEARKHRLTSIIASGHSGGTRFWGNVGEITRDNIDRVLQDYPRSHDSLRSVFLWGCHSAEREAVNWWRATFPRLKLVVGYAGIAPGAGTDASPALLEDAMRREAEMTRQMDLRHAARLMRSLAGANQVNVAIAMNSCYVGRHFGSTMLNIAQDCSDAEAALRDDAAYFQDCFAANSSCPNPPANTHHSRLRNFYAMYQRFASCHNSSDFMRSLPSREKVLALIFFDNVRRNFAAFFQDQLTQANQLLGQDGAAAGARFPDLSSSSLTRGEALAAIARVRAATQRPGSGLRDNAAIRELLDRSGTLLNNLNCVPSLWVTEEPEPGHAPDAPSC